MAALVPILKANVILYAYQLERRTILVSVLIIYRKKGIRVNARPQKHWLMENVDFVRTLIRLILLQITITVLQVLQIKSLD